MTLDEIRARAVQMKWTPDQAGLIGDRIRNATMIFRQEIKPRSHELAMCEKLEALADAVESVAYRQVIAGAKAER